MDNVKNKGFSVVKETEWALCLWQMPEGGYLASEPGVFLSMEGKMGDYQTEQAMRKEVKYWVGSDEGTPVWFPGYRKVTDSERDDQVERLLDGKIPDWVDEIRQTKRAILDAKRGRR